MKKLLCFMFALVLVMGLTVSAMAVNSKTFNLNVQCVNTSDLTYRTNYDVRCEVAGRMYVYHYPTNSDKTYTNLYHAIKSPLWLLAQKWATPNLDVPIQANTLTVNLMCDVAARGNTDYYTYAGLTNLTLYTRFSGK